eukprot:1992511-Rhodomonas_salina.2
MTQAAHRSPYNLHNLPPDLTDKVLLVLSIRFSSAFADTSPICHGDAHVHGLVQRTLINPSVLQVLVRWRPA